MLRIHVGLYVLKQLDLFISVHDQTIKEPTNQRLTTKLHKYSNNKGLALFRWSVKMKIKTYLSEVGL